MGVGVGGWGDAGQCILLKLWCLGIGQKQFQNSMEI